MEEIILKVKNLNVRFGNEEIIKNLSFEIKKGEFLILLGPNGAGKSTLLKAILGLIPFRGEVAWNKKLKIGYLPEKLSQEKFKTLPILVKEFFQFKEKNIKKINDILKLVGLEPKEVLKKNPGYLSSGEFQRMLIAWSLISEPEILFFDEPSSGIDISREETIYSLLKKIWQERKLTIVLVTHDLNIVYKYATNVLCLNKKGVYCLGASREILTPTFLEKIYGTEINFYEHKH